MLIDHRIYKKTIIFTIIDNDNNKRTMIERFAKDCNVKVDFSYCSTDRKFFKTITNYFLHIEGEKENIDKVEKHCLKLQKHKYLNKK